MHGRGRAGDGRKLHSEQAVGKQLDFFSRGERPERNGGLRQGVGRRQLCYRYGGYEVGATVVSSNRPIEDWGQLLGDTAATGAMLDRFLHHADVVQLQGKSYRMHDRQQRRSSKDLTNEPG